MQLAHWEFGQGKAYCAMCDAVCPACPRRVNAPHSHEAASVWAMAGKIDGQWRHALLAGPGGLASVPTGYDMASVMQIAQAMGVDLAAVAEFLPVIEYAALTANQESFDG